jgi:sulfate adenylyltransferase subunit 1
MSALAGDNVVEPSNRMDWYGGGTLLSHLENVPLGADLTDQPLRLPVQYVLRDPSGDQATMARWPAGQLASGVIRVGDRVVVQLAGVTSTVVSLSVLGRETDIAWAPQSVAVRLADDIDLARGDILTTDPGPVPVTSFTATVCHLDERPLRARQRVRLKHGARTVAAVIEHVAGRLNTADGRWQPAEDGLSVNDIGSVRIRTAEPIAVDDYAANKRTGSFVLIDPHDGATLSAGMVDAGMDHRRGAAMPPVADH